MTKKGLLKRLFMGAIAVATVSVAAVFAPSILLIPLVYFGGKAVMVCVMAAGASLMERLKFRKDQKAYPTYPMEGQSLTEGEAAFVKSIFGNKIKTGRIRKYVSLYTTGDDTVAKAFGRKRIKFYLDALETDYSKPKDFGDAAIFIHETTHLLQAGNPLREAFNRIFHTARDKKYEYELSPKSRFSKFGAEQQASIMGDYTLQFMNPENTSEEAGIRDEYLSFHDAYPQKLSLLKKVVEDKFPEARKTRIALEAKRKAAPAAP